jgi:hypothetical protein
MMARWRIADAKSSLKVMRPRHCARNDIIDLVRDQVSAANSELVRSASG